MADGGIAAANEKQAYVSNSRFREDQVIYTTDLPSAREMMSRSGERKLAVEMETAYQVATGASTRIVAPLHCSEGRAMSIKVHAAQVPLRPAGWKFGVR